MAKAPTRSTPAASAAQGEPEGCGAERVMLTRLAVILAAAAMLFASLSVFESRVLGLFPLGEVPPRFDAYHLARSAGALLLSVLIVATIYRGRQAGSPLGRTGIGPRGGAAALAVLALALGSTLLLVADPPLFGRTAREDSAVEWASALLLLTGSGLFLWISVRRMRAGEGKRARTILALLLAALLFATGMEEISWLQRVIGFETPDELARANMQREFNLHNLHTDLSENVYYLGAFALLILAPFVRDSVASLGRLGWLDDLAPRRWVVAAAAPLSIFNYGMWNVVPMQMTMMLTVLIAACCAHAALRRGDRAEGALFALLAVAVTAGQAVFLSRAHLLPNIWDPSEHKELFIAIGLACHAFDAALRERRRSGSKRER